MLVAIAATLLAVPVEGFAEVVLMQARWADDPARRARGAGAGYRPRVHTLAPPIPGTRVVGLPPPPLGRDDDDARRRGLRRMKVVALGLLLLATAVFVVASVFDDDLTWLRPVRATAEAAMVGALADWFAVTALFRHPLGLPIPHTAIIPENKARIGRVLGTFVQEHFLSPDIVSQRVRDAGVANRAGSWLAQPDNAARAAGTFATVLVGVADVLDDESASGAIAHTVVTRVEETPASPVLAKALEVAIDEGHHHALVESILRAASDYLDEHRGVLRQRIAVESPWWVPEPLDDRIFEKVVGGAKRFLVDLQTQPDHELRRGIDRRLTALVQRLHTDRALAERVEERKRSLLEHPSVQAWAASLWTELKTGFARSARDPSSELRRRLGEAIASGGARLRDDPELQATVDAWFAEALYAAAEEYGPSAAAYIEATVERWDTDETTERLELLVGRDLQFIRINGTVVGGLAGLLIYAIGHLL